MRATWAATYASLVARLSRRSAEASFAQMQRDFPELASLRGIPDLVEHQRDLATDPARRYGLVRSLVAAAQSGAVYDQAATLIILVVLWPGLDAVHWRLCHDFPQAREEMAEDVLARVTLAIRRLDLTRVEKATATLLMNVERDIKRKLIAARVRAKDERDADDPAVAAQMAAFAEPAQNDGPDFAELVQALRPTDRRLLTRVFVLGETQEQAGAALGLSVAAARKRYQRAIARLGGK